jgi:nicotinamide-nucleotide amidase
MVDGLKAVSGSDLCISVTGIAGPDGGTPEKPVGLVYIGFIYGDKRECYKIKAAGRSRKGNRNYTLLSMLDIINKNI